MAATEKGVWDLQDVRDKQLASEWTYDAPSGDAGKLFMWGRNDEAGQLGVNDIVTRSSPIQVPGTKWARVNGSMSGYGKVMLGVKSDGSLWGVGRNFNRQMSAAAHDEISSPAQIGTSPNWSTNFDGGDDFCGAIDNSGNLYMWGKNQQGQLGQNESGNPSALPAMVQVPGTWLSFANAYSSAAATKSA